MSVIFLMPGKKFIQKMRLTVLFTFVKDEKFKD
jgi:hypothetical protein